MRICKPLLALLLLLICATAGNAAGDPYLGVGHEPSSDPPGLLINVVPGSPADRAGLRSGDVITAVDGHQMADAPDGKYDAVLREALVGRELGDSLLFSIHRSIPSVVLHDAAGDAVNDFPLDELRPRIDGLQDGQSLRLEASRIPEELEISVVLGPRPDTLGEPFPANDELPCRVDDLRPGIKQFRDELIARAGIAADCEDLAMRLDRRATPDDGYRFQRTVYLLRDGFKGEPVTRAITGKLTESMVAGISGYSQIQYTSAELMDLYDQDFPQLADNKDGTLDDDLQLLKQTLEDSDALVRRAFAGFSEEELTFLDRQRAELTEAFRQWHYIDSEDSNARRVADNLRLIELAKRIDYASLQQAQLKLSSLAQINFLKRLEQELLASYAGNLADDELLRMETAAGDIVVNGTGRSWQRKDDAVLRIDLGGDDFYTNAAGSATGISHPVGVLIEFGGNDAYESTTQHCQGSGSMGCGLLIDMSGNDQYIGLQWAQGCAFLGCGALVDYSGNDIYRGEELCQAAAIFGSGIIFDISGNDRFEAQQKSQAFGGAHGIGLLLDAEGHDYRYAKGKYPTGYGDAGIFDSWSQGCAQGFRNRASGGIAGIVDLEGEDYNEAGNFSQGGGYYFGYGFFHDVGQQDDHYIGSRYNQGFCAHQAVGVFLEEGGNDWYQTRQSVSQGLAWDECSTVFIDYLGNDRYEGGGGFSQGASAHNAVCLMWDMNGDDVYDYPAGQARAGGNDYHGGTSLSLFIDAGGGNDSYNSKDGANDKVSGWPAHGFFADLPGSLADALLDQAWQQLWQDPPAAE
ncbi:MAG: PDZ domain-containing protein [Planctomycetales bacterium]|nr:PDZ domain-containing protein [bacterium]UNM07640.1 MAG: PDZ domain-containing protein [Planctomycetales bacterium]